MVVMLKGTNYWFGLGSAHIRHIETRKQKRLDKGTNYSHFENLVAKSTHLKY